MLYRVAGMIRDVLSWWSRQMLDLVPGRFARPEPSAVGALVVEPLGAAGARLVRRRGGEESLLGDVTIGPMLDTALEARGETGGGIVLLRLPAGAALQRDVTLPLAAEPGLDRVLGYEMDRLTPFAAADVFYAWIVLARDREAGRLRLRLSLVPRAPLLPLLSALADAGASPQAIEIQGGATGRALRIPLAHVRPAAARRERRALLLAGGGCLALALLAIILPFLLQSAALSRVDRRIALLQPRVQAVQALRRQIAGSSAGADQVAAERQRLGDALAVLAAVTRVLPDDSYLSDLTLRQGQLMLSGQSPAAARLIPALSADPAFSAPTFSAPVTRIEGQNTELFSIRAGVAR